uniref:Ribbon-helix-helix protein, copG family n=1 Tax=Candidatus Kentrum sp. SD TaxID=2126332 RepID=A0A450YMZ7_9GAMM|nr:MAG: hypothetical protein BECKSD772F_GA0070984_11323 [Candidatus Kentron sp. SD]VFK48624.1 MAG: hypothetical protein BECKSD772E_GA0070983_11333 [Candidatus Kentron sp. SD]VFK80669.1 MAG: hypothetical protein BECKSD772D_GA0070982_11395 [Candidatus Kentron sp. SD]
MNTTLAIRADDTPSILLGEADKRDGRDRSDITRKAIRRKSRIIRFRNPREQAMPFAAAAQ